MVISFEADNIDPDLPGVIVLSHGGLAAGIVDSMRLIIGEADNVAYLELEEGDDPDEFGAHFKRIYEAYPAKTVALLDVFGGTPFNQVMAYFLGEKKDIRAVVGVNLGMLIEAVNNRDMDEDFLDGLEETGRQSVIDLGRTWVANQA